MNLTGMTYQINGVPVQIRGKEANIGKVAWDEEPLEKNANELEEEKKSRQEEKRDRKLDMAVALIRSSLPMTPPDLEKKLVAEGLSRSAMYRAKDAINESTDPIYSEQIGAKNERRWWLTSQWKKRPSFAWPTGKSLLSQIIVDHARSKGASSLMSSEEEETSSSGRHRSD